MRLLPGFRVVALSFLATCANAADTDRGKSLYESRCDTCHESSVHSRAARSARTFDHIRAFVSRWDRELGQSWTNEEINEVARYLNERYYHYPCPVSVCRSKQARLP
jgi:mono/diheme cytochrome c family protein